MTILDGDDCTGDTMNPAPTPFAEPVGGVRNTCVHHQSHR